MCQQDADTQPVLDMEPLQSDGYMPPLQPKTTRCLGISLCHFDNWNITILLVLGRNPLIAPTYADNSTVVSQFSQTCSSLIRTLAVHLQRLPRGRLGKDHCMVVLRPAGWSALFYRISPSTFGVTSWSFPATNVWCEVIHPSYTSKKNNTGHITKRHASDKLRSVQMAQ